MHTFPFCSIEEAEANALSLCRALEFCEVCNPSSESGAPIDIGLQRTQGLIAKALGYAQWEDLMSALTSGGLVMYFDMCPDRDTAHRTLAISLARSLGGAELADDIKRALSLSAFGCAPKILNEAYCQLNCFPCKTFAQWQRLQVLQSGYAYVSRYHRGRSAYEIDMLDWEHRKKIAEVLGTKVPRKPKKPNGT